MTIVSIRNAVEVKKINKLKTCNFLVGLCLVIVNVQEGRLNTLNDYDVGAAADVQSHGIP